VVVPLFHAGLAALLLAVAGSPPAATPPCTLDGLGWLAGAWASDTGGTRTEEVWLEPRGGTMLGVNRSTRGERTLSFEFLRIDCGPEGPVYWGSPGGKPPAPFRLTSLAGRRAVFENPSHDFPTRILYWLDDEGAMHARVEGPEGREKALEWTWRRVEAPARP
jgi:hypothetical protein